MKKCPYCAEEIQDEAIKCKYCGSNLKSSDRQGSSEPTNQKIQSKSNYLWPWGALIVLFVFLVVGGVIFYFFSVNSSNSTVIKDVISKGYQKDIDAIALKLVQADQALRYDNFNPQLNEDILAIYVQYEGSSNSAELYQKYPITSSSESSFNDLGTGELTYNSSIEKCLICVIHNGGRSATVFIRDRNYIKARLL